MLLGSPVHSELQGVRSVVLSEGETGVQVLSEESSFLVGFKILQDSLIDFRLQFFAVLRNFLFLTRQLVSYSLTAWLP